MNGKNLTADAVPGKEWTVKEKQELGQPQQRISVAIVDNDQFAVSALTGLLNHYGISVAWHETQAQKALTYLRDHPVYCQILILDLKLGTMQGTALTRIIRQEDCLLPVIMMTANPISSETARAVHDCGAQGLDSKSQGLSIIRDIREVIVTGKGRPNHGISFLTVQEALENVHRINKVGFDSLSDREKQVVCLCSEGYSDKEIAVHLGVKRSSAETWVKRACLKLKAVNRTDLVAKWLRYCDAMG